MHLLLVRCGLSGSGRRTLKQLRMPIEGALASLCPLEQLTMTPSEAEDEDPAVCV